MSVSRILSYIRQLDDPQQGLYARTVQEKWSELRTFVQSLAAFPPTPTSRGQAPAPAAVAGPTWDQLQALATKHSCWVPGYGPFAAELLATYGAAPETQPHWAIEWMNAMHHIRRNHAPAPKAAPAPSVTYTELPDFDTVEQRIYAGCRRFISGDMLEPIHGLIREAIDADRASRKQAPAAQEAALHYFDAGWKAAARFCDREDAVADGIIGHGACPQFERAFDAARAAEEGSKR